MIATSGSVLADADVIAAFRRFLALAALTTPNLPELAALGGIIAGLSITSRTEVLAVVLGALFVAEVTSVVVQILAFRTTGRRVFRMAPFHHHFELVGWAETTVIIRFWLLTAIACGLGASLFYSEWLAAIGD